MVSKVIKKNKKSNLAYWLMLVPGLLSLLIFNYLPMFGSIIAFKDYNYFQGIFKSPWVGFKHFEFFFSSNDLLRLLRNTILYNFAFMFLIAFLASAIVALMLYEVKSKLLVKFYQTSMLLPYFISWVIVAAIVLLILNPSTGFLNSLLSVFGVEPVMWYSNPSYWPVILFLVELWKSVGMGSLYFYASLLSIDPCLFEAAELDGAGKFKQIWYISVPEMMPMACVLLVTRVGSILGGDFGLYYQVTMDSGALYPTTDVMGTYIYRGLAAGNVSSTAAIGLFQSVVGLVLVIVTNKVIKKISPKNAMF